MCAGSNCVEMALTSNGEVLVRDSKNPEQEPLNFSRLEMRSWIQAAKAGEFDDLS
jgi:hypothetical protein